MSLTSTSLQVCAVLAAVLATAAALLLWNRVRGPKAVRVGSRVGLLLAGYLCTAIAMLVSVNIAYGGLIVSWSDLFSNLNPPMVPHMKHSGPHGPNGPNGVPGGVGDAGEIGAGLGWGAPNGNHPHPTPTATTLPTDVALSSGHLPQ